VISARALCLVVSYVVSHIVKRGRVVGWPVV
jgi:hypothetical protein